ncbi:hypothetical protein Tco_1401130 [Tanacetum coccineum]
MTYNGYTKHIITWALWLNPSIAGHGKAQTRVGFGPELNDPSADPLVDDSVAVPLEDDPSADPPNKTAELILGPPSPRKGPNGLPLIEQKISFSCSSTRSSFKSLGRPDPDKGFMHFANTTRILYYQWRIRGTLTQPLKRITGPRYAKSKKSRRKDKLNAFKRTTDICAGTKSPEIAKKEATTNHTTLNPRLSPHPEEDAEIGIPEAHHRTPVYSKDLRKTDPFHRGPGHGKKEACLIGWEERKPVSYIARSDSVGKVPRKKKLKSRDSINIELEDDLYQPWTCEERNPFTPRIRHFSLPRTRMPSHVKTYDGSGDPEDHLKLFQSAAKTEGWAMPTWCHMFNSTLTGNARVWFDKLPKESIDSYEDLSNAYREITFSKQSISRTRWRYTISSKEMENLRRTSWKDTRQKSWT